MSVTSPAKQSAPRKGRKSESAAEAAAERAILREIDAALARLDAGVATQQKKIDELLASLNRRAA